MIGGVANCKILELQTTDSTHKFAIRLIESGKAEELAIIAKKQTDGVGKYSRSWESPSGNLYLSIIQKLLWHRDLGKLSLTVAAAIHKVILRYIADDLYLHWPNDVYYKELKVAGILIAVMDSWVVISVGVNVNSTPDIARAVSIKDVSKIEVISIGCLLESILAELDVWFQALRVCGFSVVKDYWLRYVNEANRKVAVKNGRGFVSGLFMGIDDFGRLILREHDRDLFISSGDVFLGESGES